jgi:hypothetical protein
VPHRRPRKKGSFGGHFDELVTQFPEHPASSPQQQYERPAELQQKLDIHARLFERAWRVDN